MRYSLFFPLGVSILFALALLACDLSSLATLTTTSAPKPVAAIQSPPNGSEFREGDEILFQSNASNKTGIARIELIVDGVIVRTDTPPLAGQETFLLIQKWTATAGTHLIVVRAYNRQGVASEPATIAINVASAAPTPAALVIATPAVAATIAATLAPRVASPTAQIATRTPTRVPVTSTPNIPAGVYGVSVRVEPESPKRGQFITFHVTFLNTTGEAKSYRWFVKIFEPDKTNSFGETSKKQEDILVGRHEIASPTDWRITGPGPCQQYFARVFWVNPDSKEVVEFVKPDFGGGPAAGFQVCP